MRPRVDLDELVDLDPNAAGRGDLAAHQIVLHEPIDRDRRDVGGAVRHDAAVVPERDLLRPPRVEDCRPDDLRDLLARPAAVRERARHEAAGLAVVLQIAEHLRHRMRHACAFERGAEGREARRIRLGRAVRVEVDPLLFRVDAARFEEEMPQREAPFGALLPRLAHQGDALVDELLRAPRRARPPERALRKGPRLDRRHHRHRTPSRARDHRRVRGD